MLIAFPNVDDAVRESRIAQKQNPKPQENDVQHPAFLQNPILYQDQFLLVSQVNPHSSRTTPEKRDLFARLADHLNVLAAEVERAIAAKIASSRQ